MQNNKNIVIYITNVYFYFAVFKMIGREQQRLQNDTPSFGFSKVRNKQNETENVKFKENIKQNETEHVKCKENIK